MQRRWHLMIFNDYYLVPVQETFSGSNNYYISSMSTQIHVGGVDLIIDQLENIPRDAITTYATTNFDEAHDKKEEEEEKEEDDKEDDDLKGGEEEQQEKYRAQSISIEFFPTTTKRTLICSILIN